MKLKRSHKNLCLLEAGYIYCKRRGIEYDDDKFVDEIFMSKDFQSNENSEYDNICKDLRFYKYFDSYKLIEITDEEYEMCVRKLVN